MSKYEGTQTAKNLETAFAGESMARNKYTYFASKAKKDGFQQIAALFEETANNEKEHAKSLKALATPQQTLQLLLRERTTSGPICMPDLPRPQKKKDFRSLPQSSGWWQRSKRPTRSVTVHFSRTWRPQASLQSQR